MLAGSIADHLFSTRMETWFSRLISETRFLTGNQMIGSMILVVNRNLLSQSQP
ncbi:hypothetical protein CEV31_3586 [Brucella thiophenivorans]|uniref:Uncharacterized protein n=1 Tax=Brucella thiophenivorans TaxID=571255 RepID=A0A256FBL7_9HYPH|nr:hypothetical protein CEV31_3586 [Brucella thiophenivorans]